MSGLAVRGGATGAASVAGVVGSPVRHSLSPLIHGAWIAAAGLDALYAPFAVAEDRFERFVDGLRGGAVAGLNVTVPFKARAFALADVRSAAAEAAGAANLLLFAADGSVAADNTDGAGLLAALAEQAPAWRAAAGPAVVLGAGGAARGAAAALLAAGAPEVRIVNRTQATAEALAAALDGPARACGWDAADAALADAALVVNATILGLGGTGEIPPLRPPPGCTAMDMVYKPLRTAWLQAMAGQGLATVDGLAMLIGQARPSFEAFYGQAPPADADVRGLALRSLGEAG